MDLIGSYLRSLEEQEQERDYEGEREYRQSNDRRYSYDTTEGSIDEVLLIPRLPGQYVI